MNDRLREKIERVAGHPIVKPQDFRWLADEIEQRLGVPIGVNTLKRFFGYNDGSPVETRRSTLDILARYVGYSSYDTFLMATDDADGVSHEVLADHLLAQQLPTGAMVELRWLPDRRIVAKHLGNCRFEIREAEKTKLLVGDTFECQLFISGEPCYLEGLRHAGASSPSVYVAGLTGGTQFKVR